MTQSKSDIISEAVMSAVSSAFTPELRSKALDILSEYGLGIHERETERVHLAVITLCGGNMDELKAWVAEAKKDYRNILYWNEQASK